jgi:hypothetical protein
MVDDRIGFISISRVTRQSPKFCVSRVVHLFEETSLIRLIFVDKYAYEAIPLNVLRN